MFAVEECCTDELAEFSGTLVGFDDYVSEYFLPNIVDMILIYV